MVLGGTFSHFFVWFRYLTVRHEIPKFAPRFFEIFCPFRIPDRRSFFFFFFLQFGFFLYIEEEEEEEEEEDI